MKLKAYSLLISLLFLRLAATAQTVGETRAFADSLFSAGQTDAALPVYERAAYFMRPDIDAHVLERIADCFLAAGQTEKALEYFDHSYFNQTSDSIKKELIFKKAACFLHNKNYKYALMELYSMDAGFSSDVEEKKNFFIGMSWFGLEDFGKAAEYFEKAVEIPSSKQKIRKLFADQKKFFRPNPKTASWLSVFIPGAGQFYSGEVLSGINSLLLTSSFVALGLYIVVVTSPLDAIFTALPWFQRYYQGGFQRAGELAKNKRAENRNQVFNQVIDIIANETN